MIGKIPTPKIRMSLTPNSNKPVLFDQRQDTTPQRQQNISFYDHHQVSVITHEPLQFSGREEERISQKRRIVQQKLIASNDGINRLIQNRCEKENTIRMPGSSFCDRNSNSKELQIQVSELKTQKDNISFTLNETQKKNNILSSQIEKLQQNKNEQIIQYKQNLDQFFLELNALNEKLSYFQQENQRLQEEQNNQQWYISQLEQSNAFNKTQNFGQI